MNRAMAVLTILATTTLVSCGSHETTDACSELGLPSDKILYGTKCGGEVSAAVVRLDLLDRHNDKFGSCSGTVITATEVLTAAHCVLDRVRKVKVHVGNQSIESSFLVSHPDADVSEDGIGKPDKDVAIVHLSRPTAVAPIPLLVSREFRKDEEFLVFGFGLDENGDGNDLRSGRMKADKVKSGYIESEHTDESAGLCFGDSGGPAIASVNSGGIFVPAIVGVASGLSAPGLFGGGLPLPGPFPLPLPFQGQEQDCEVGATNYHANTQLTSVLDFIQREAPAVSLR